MFLDQSDIQITICQDKYDDSGSAPPSVATAALLAKADAAAPSNRDMTKDFSIFVDRSQIAALQTSSSKPAAAAVAGAVEKSSASPKFTEDGSLFVYDQTTRKPSSQPQRQALQPISDNMCLLEDEIPPFDMRAPPPPFKASMLSETTCNSVTTRMLDFEPPAASTRSIKPYLQMLQDETIEQQTNELKEKMTSFRNHCSKGR